MSAIDVTNPRTGQTDYSISPATADELAKTVAAVRTAQPAWANLSLDDRARALTELGAAIAGSSELRTALETDTGRRAIAAVETSSIPGMIERQIADARTVLADPGELPSGFSHIAVRNQLVPLGVVGIISPWNFPLLLSMIDSLPALIAGCGVVLKPSEVTPRYLKPLQALIDAIPALSPVFRGIYGDGRVGSELIDHVDAVAFTGSVRTGRKVAEAAARNFIPAFLEMGGKDPAIVLSSADVGKTAAAILRASVAATGQACQSLERVYVHRSIHDELVKGLVSEAQQVELTVEDPERGHIGPFIFPRQAEVVEAHIADAVAKGAKVETGGEIVREGGAWCPPTVLSGVNHDMLVMTDETFGPVIPVMAYDTVEEAIELANDTVYGLSASVFAGSEEQAIPVAIQLEGGAVSINDGSLTAMVHGAENDTFKQSGLGRSRMGPSGVRRYFRQKAIMINRGEAAPIQAYGEAKSLPAGEPGAVARRQAQ